MKRNPYIEPHNAYEQLNASQEKLKNQPEIVELAKLCYSTFYCNKEGKMLLKYLNDKFLAGAISPIGIGDYGHECIRSEAIRSMVRMFNDQIESHKQRIRAEVSK